MKINDCLHGFTVNEVKKLDEIGAVMYHMTFQKNGAELVWFDREDENMTYSIAFKTLPENDTGVFHILEHSVLNGSEKFPLKEPFVDLLKGSLQTFLNAMTYPDKTIYPVSSRNRKDFLNLINVYTDAVFHPCIYTRPETFMQEGWHYEYDSETKKLTRNGVVYSEMKGAFSSVDTQAFDIMQRLLFPDLCYRYNSGGNPDYIPNLTYDEFLDTHRKYYHPSNAKIILDGSIELDEVLALLETYLLPYEKSDTEFHIGSQNAVSNKPYIAEYEIGTNENAESRDCFLDGYVYGTYSDYEVSYAMQILADVLTGSNEAPLRKAVLDHKLGDAVYIENEGLKYLVSCISVKNMSASKTDALQGLIHDTLEGLCRDGLDHDQIYAAINSFEFSMRERDFGNAPKGIVFAMSAYDTWLYGGDPSATICFGDVFERLRAAVADGYFENLIQRTYLNNAHHSTVVMKASTTLGLKKQSDQEKELDAILESMGENDLEKVISDFERLVSAQQTPDSPETSALLPHLHLSDIQQEVKPYRIKTEILDGITVLHSPQETNGILYGDLYFDISDMNTEEIPYVSFLCEMLCETETDSHSAIEIQRIIKRDLGNLSSGTEFIEHFVDEKSSKPYCVINFSVLDGKIDCVANIVSEIALHSVFSDTTLIENMLKQRKLGMYESIQGHGNSFGAMRVAASNSSRGVFTELCNGIEYYKWICKQTGSECNFTEFGQKLHEIAARVFCRNRLTIALTGKYNNRLVSELIEAFPIGDDYRSLKLKPLQKKNAGFAIPSDVSYAVKGFNLAESGEMFNGSMRVVSTMLSYNYLWNAIRVQNGAYGAGMGVGMHGDVQFSTYRDPLPAHSLMCFDASGSILLENEIIEEELEGLIIGTLGESEPIRTPRMEGKHAITCTLCGLSTEQIRKNRVDLLATNEQSIVSFAEILNAQMPNATSCIIGSRSSIEECNLDYIEEL